MSLSLKIGLDALNSYRRLAYTPWHAIAEYVDNATQSYFDNEEILDEAYSNEEEDQLEVSIVYDSDDDGRYLRISDNAMGMAFEDIERAMHIAGVPTNTSGRSKYGMGLKTASFWLGDLWKVRTKKLGESVEFEVTIDIDHVNDEGGALPYEERSGRPLGEHYTIVTVSRLNREFKGRTLGKIRDYLRSMYRQDFRNAVLSLVWRGERLSWQERDMLADRDGNEYRKEIRFGVGGKSVTGWVGILAKGTRANAGFSIIHCGRVIKGWPDAWRPSSLYGQIQGSNDLVNQRLVGEVHLDDFEVSHTKDDILWLGNEEEDIEDALEKRCSDYKEIAKEYRKGDDDERGPDQAEVDVAVDELRRELLSPEMQDRIEISNVPPPGALREMLTGLTSTAESRGQDVLDVKIGDLHARVFLASDMSVNDPYVVVDSAQQTAVLVLVNTGHPHWAQLKGSDGVLNYLRHCTYDGIAEWQAKHRAAQIDTDTIKILKDALLRVSFDIEKHGEALDG